MRTARRPAKAPPSGSSPVRSASVPNGTTLPQAPNAGAPAQSAKTLVPGALNLTVPTTAGSRLNLTPLQTPAAVSTIPGDQIRLLGDQSILEAETRAVGVTGAPTDGNGGNVVASRGFYGTNSIVQLYDGIQLFNAGGVVAFPFDPWNVERIDVLSGSSSVLYGTGGIGGAINVIPKEPDPTHQSTAFQGSVGSFNTLHSALDVTGPISPQLAYRFDLSQYTSDGWTHPNGDSRSLAMSGALTYAPVANFKVTLRDDYGNINPSTYEGTPTQYGATFNALRFTNYNIADAYVDFRQNYLDLKEDWVINPNISFRNDTYLIDQYRRYHDGYTYSLNPFTDNISRTLFRDISAVQQQIGDHGFTTITSQPFGFDNQTLFGFDLNGSIYNRQDNQTGGNQGKSTVNAFDFIPGTYASTGATLAKPQYILDLKQNGIFTEDRFAFTKYLSVVGGYRFDQYTTHLLTYPANSVTNGVYTGPGYHVGLIFNPIPTVALYTRYSVSSDPVTSLASDNVANISFGLSPAQQYEVGAKADLLNNRLEGTLAAYKIIKNNLLTTSPSNPQMSETVGEQSSRGIEGSLSYRLTDDVRFQANGTILHAKFDDYSTLVNGKLTSLAGYEPFFVPQKAANVLAFWTFLPHWELRGVLRFVGDRFADNTNLYKLPAYSVVDLGLRWNATKNISLDLRVNNLTDRIYALSGSSGVGSQFQLGEPRSVTGMVNMVF